MSVNVSRPAVLLSAEDLEVFSAASHDRNPVHTSEAYARRTPFGGRVVHGVLGGLACLAKLGAREGRELARVSFEFTNAIFLDETYDVSIQADSADAASLRLVDGRRTLLRAEVAFRERRTAPAAKELSGEARTTAAVHPEANLVAGFTTKIRYAAEANARARLMARFRLDEVGAPEAQLSALLACSYAVGMELPGEKTIFSSVALTFEQASQGSFDLTLRVDAAQERMGLLQLSAVFEGADTAFARAKLMAFVRRDLEGPTLSEVESACGRSDALKGRVAIVTGASRGLGAATAMGLALHGCTVLGSYLSSAEAMDRLQSQCVNLPGELIALAGDSADPAWCESARAAAEARGSLDLLVLNASTPVRPLSLEPTGAQRIRRALSEDVARALEPLAHLAPLLERSSGQVFVVSSGMVTKPAAESAHHIMAKAAIEGLATAASREYPKIAFTVVRPPRMLTDWTNTPLGRHTATPPQRIAAGIIARARTPIAGVSVLEEFPVR